MSANLRRIHPAPPAPITIEEAYTAPRPRHEDRPWIGVCMVQSVDGSIAVDGGSSQLGNVNDLDTLLTLRRMCDLVIVGAGTVRGEGYGPPKKAGQRIGVVTNSGAVDLDDDLFASGAGFVITSQSADVDEARVDVVRAGVDEVDIAAAVRLLDQVEPDLRWVQAEGGAALNGSLLDAGLIDEIMVNLSPYLVGGDAPRITSGARESMRDYELAHVLTDDEGYLFLRYLARDVTDGPLA